MAYLKLAAALAFAAGLMAFPSECAEAARRAMASWANSVAPALFPFAAVMPFLTCSEAQTIYAKLLGPAVEKLFRLPRRTAPAIVVGLSAGSPAGALAATRVAAENRLNKGQLARLSGIVCGVSPIYALSVMGDWRFLAAQLAAQLLTGIAFRNLYNRNNTTIELNISPSAEKPVQTAVQAALRVCGYMVLFSVAITLAAQFLGDDIWLIAAFLDLPSGTATCPPALLPLAMGFGGLCIGFQNLGALKDMVKPSAYFVQKICSAVLCWGGYAILESDMRKRIAISGKEFELYVLFLMAIMLVVLPIFLRKTYFLTFHEGAKATPKFAKNHNI